MYGYAAPGYKHRVTPLAAPRSAPANTCRARRTSVVYVVPVAQHWLLYAPLARLSALLNEPAVLALSRGQKVPQLAELNSALASVLPEPRCPSGELNPQFLGILPTRTCNLDCIYCGFGAQCASPEVMDLSVAVSAVDWMAERVLAQGRLRLDVHLFGGEPFCAPNVVEAVAHRTRSAAAKRGLIPFLEVATNGVHDETVCGFVADHFDAVILSLDGPQSFHNRNRPCRGGAKSFDSVTRTAKLLGRSNVELCLRCCVTSDSVPKLEETAEWLCSEFTPNAVNFEPLQPTLRSAAAGIVPPDPWEFAVHYVRAERIARRSGVRLVYAATDTDQIRATSCPLGTDSALVSPDGRISACYLEQQEWKDRGLDLDFGRASRDCVSTDSAAVERIRSVVMNRPPRCSHCFARMHCAGGCYVYHSSPDCASYDDYCIQTRIVSACRILTSLGLHDLVDTLLANDRALRRLALHPSDTLVHEEAVCD